MDSKSVKNSPELLLLLIKHFSAIFGVMGYSKFTPDPPSPTPPTPWMLTGFQKILRLNPIGIPEKSK